MTRRPWERRARIDDSPELVAMRATKATERYQRSLHQALGTGDAKALDRLLDAFPAGDPDGLLRGLMTAVLLATDLDANTRERLLDTTRKVWPQSSMLAQERLWLVRKMTASGSWECAPLLHAFGCRLPDEATNLELYSEFSMALGRGLWSYPELFCPDLMRQPRHIEIMAKSLFTHREGYPGGLHPAHLERLISSVDPFWEGSRSLVANSVSAALAGCAFDISSWHAFEAIPETERHSGLHRLMEAGWVDENLVAGHIFLPWEYSDRLLSELTQLRYTLLDEATAAAPAATSRGPRL